MMNRNPNLAVSSWGRGSNAPREVRFAERPLEESVSDYVGGMTLVFLPVPDAAGPDSARGVIERNSIALLSNFVEPTADAASPTWLGHHCGRIACGAPDSGITSTSTKPMTRSS